MADTATTNRPATGTSGGHQAGSLAEQARVAAAVLESLYPGMAVSAIGFRIDEFEKPVWLPTRPSVEPESSIPGLTARQSRMVGILRSEPGPLTQKALAMRLVPDGRGKLTGSAHAEFVALVKRGLIRQRDDLYTDDDNKFVT